MRRTINGIVLVCFLVTTGCALNKTQKASLEGGAIGAAVGAGIGQLLGKDTESTVVGASIGAAVGAALAYNYAAKLDNERKKLAGRENDLDARISYAQAVNEETRKYNQKLTADINTIEASVNEGKVKKHDLAKVQAKLKQDIKSVNTALVDLKAYRQRLKREEHPKQKVNHLDHQIESLQTQLAILESNTEKLARLNRRVKA